MIMSSKSEQINKGRRSRTPVFTLLTVLLLFCALFSTVAPVSAENVVVGPNLAVRTLKIASVGPGCGGFVGHVIVDLESEGNEAGLGFTLGYNQNILTNPQVTISTYAQSRGFVLTVNYDNVAIGRLGVLVDSGGSGFQLSPPDRRVVQIAFNVVAGSPTGPTPITFIPNNAVPAPATFLSASTSGADNLPITGQDGSLMIGGTACTTSADVSVGGRVMTPDGGGLRGAQVVLTDSKGNRRTVMTSSLGYYQLDGVKSGETYVIGVSSRRYRFNSRAVQVADNLTDLDFVGIE